MVGRTKGGKRIDKDTWWWNEKVQEAIKRKKRAIANTGREIVTDRFFTSHMLARRLLEMKLTFLGTIKGGRKEIPKCIREVKAESCIPHFLYTTMKTKLFCVPMSQKRTGTS